MILLEVIDTLTLFGIVGIEFVYYSEREAPPAHLTFYPSAGRLVGTAGGLALSLPALLYDEPDDETGVYSAIRSNDYTIRPPVRPPFPTYLGVAAVLTPTLAGRTGTSGWIRGSPDGDGGANFYRLMQLLARSGGGTLRVVP